MRFIMAVVLVLASFTALAGTINSLDQPTIRVQGGGEYFMTVTGSGLGNRVRYQGPAGTFELDVNANSGGVTAIAWVPQEIVSTAGTYELTVLGGPSGDSGPVSFTIQGSVRPKLTLHLPELIAIPAKSRLGLVIKYDFTTLGGEGVATVTCEPKSGSTFPFGSSLIRCIAIDQAGDRATGEIPVNVWDAGPPVLTIPKSFEVAADNEEGATVKYDVSAVDEIDGKLDVKCLPESGSLLRPGRTRVGCEAIDSSFNYASDAFEVMVWPRDLGELTLKVPAEITVTAEEHGYAVVDYEVIAYGSADPNPVVECSPPSGSTFEVGEWKVTCIAVDDFDQRAEASFGVIVKKYDSLNLSNVTAEATGPGGTEISFQDVEGWTAELQCSHDSGSLFALGKTSVDCQSRDERGVLSKGTFEVQVADTIAPHIAAVRAIPGELDVDQNRTVQVEVDALDAVDFMPRCSISALDSPAGQVTSELTLSLRGGHASGELRLRVTCVDSAGNRATVMAPVVLDARGGRGPTTN